MLNDAIYRDADFWRSFVKSRNVFPIHAVESIPFHIHIASDASMTGGGGVLDFKMAPEEIAIEWSDFEKQQHINWLEMLMVWWSIAVYKDRLAGASIDFEVDNLVTKWCLKKASSRSMVLHELVRRVWFLCLQYGIKLSVHHLAGILNVRPDGLSRGLMPAVPNIRLKKKWLNYCVNLLAQWKFDLCVGREGELMGLPEVTSDATLSGHTSFIHPRFDCIGECLWWIFEAVTKDPWHTRGVVLLPHNEEAVWWPLIQKLVVLRSLPVATFPLQCCKHDGSNYDLQLKHNLLVCCFPVMPQAVSLPVRMETVVPMDATSPVAGNTEFSSNLTPPSSPYRHVGGSSEFWLNGVAVKQGTFLFQIFDMDEREKYSKKVVTKTGKFVRQYGWLYEVLSLSSTDSVAFCKLWSKAEPSGAHPRRDVFVRTEEEFDEEGQPYKCELLPGDYLVLDVTPSVTIVKYSSSGYEPSQLKFDAVETVSNFVGLSTQVVDQICEHIAM